MPDQQLTQTVASEAKTSLKSLPRLRLNSRLVSAVGAKQLSALQKLLLETTAPFLTALTSSALRE